MCCTWLAENTGRKNYALYYYDKYLLHHGALRVKLCLILLRDQTWLTGILRLLTVKLSVNLYFVYILKFADERVYVLYRIGILFFAKCAITASTQ